jgi:hypothetical protein
VPNALEKPKRKNKDVSKKIQPFSDKFLARALLVLAFARFERIMASMMISRQYEGIQVGAFFPR